MKIEGKVTQLVAIVVIATVLYTIAPRVIDILGGIFNSIEGRNDTIESMESPKR